MINLQSPAQPQSNLTNKSSRMVKLENFTDFEKVISRKQDRENNVETIRCKSRCSKSKISANSIKSFDVTLIKSKGKF